MADDEFSSLRPSLRRAIDTTFLKLVTQSKKTRAEENSAQKRRQVDQSDDESGGGFVGSDVEDKASDDDQDDGIPLSLIPTGLQMLDLAPDDQEVLDVFRNAATGWENSRPRATRRGSDSEIVAVDRDVGLSVGKEDWRAVCAVLLGRDEEEPSGRESAQRQSASSRRPQTRASTSKKGKEKPQDSDSDAGGGFVIDSDEGGGFERASEQEDEDEPDSDDYAGSAPSSESLSEFEMLPASRKRTRAGVAEDEQGSEIEDDGIPMTLTVRQEREARLAFALFFPDVEPDDPGLETKKIGIREVADAAMALKEKLSADDIVEMLGMFSTSASGTIGLEEFGRMAVMAKLV